MLPNTTRIVFAVVIACVAGIKGATPVSTEAEHRCVGIRSRRHASVSDPLNINGLWFSPSCEMLPGPQYALRRYQFADDRFFTITRFYFSDQICREPSYSIVARGNFSSESHSWFLSEGTDVEVELTNLSIKPYSGFAARILTKILTASCSVNPAWDLTEGQTEFKEVILDPMNELCQESLLFSANELQVMRQVDYGSTREDRELQIGSVWQQPWNRPSSYQPPLYFATHKHCLACSCLQEAAMSSPPSSCHSAHLKQSSHNIDGTWFSNECESVPNGLFTLRAYTVNQTTLIFNLSVHYFTDAFCSHPSFTIVAQGGFTALKEHPSLWGTRAYEFRFEALTVILLSQRMADLLNVGNSRLCGMVSNWNLGQVYDITETSGCEALGLSIRVKEYLLIKTEQHTHAEYMQVSDSKENVQDLYTSIAYFTSKMRRCAEAPSHWLHYESQVKVHANDSRTIVLHSILVWTACILAQLLLCQ